MLQSAVRFRYYRRPIEVGPPPEPVDLSKTLYETLGEWRASAHYTHNEWKPTRFWRRDEEDLLERVYPTAKPVTDIATDLGRSVSAIRAKARSLGLRRPLRGRAADAASAIE
ncbi:MAG: hypothetical protein ABF821_12590, partial [Gluconacetobacter sp.]